MRTTTRQRATRQPLVRSPGGFGCTVGSRWPLTVGATSTSTCWSCPLAGCAASPVARLPNLSPTWAPDGGRLAFRSDHDGNDGNDGNDEVYVMNSDGSAVTRLTHADSEEQEPAFMPCTGACP